MHMATYGELGDWMRHRRAVLELTQEQLAAQAKCAVETIRALERGRRWASPALTERLLVALRIDPEDELDFDAAARGYTVGVIKPAPTVATQQPVEQK
jgi:transcriptional regulator with XRE-family HTH domain